MTSYIPSEVLSSFRQVTRFGHPRATFLVLLTDNVRLQERTDFGLILYRASQKVLHICLEGSLWYKSVSAMCTADDRTIGAPSWTDLHSVHLGWTVVFPGSTLWQARQLCLFEFLLAHLLAYPRVQLYERAEKLGHIPIVDLQVSRWAQLYADDE